MCYYLGRRAAWVGALLIGFWDVAFKPFRASLSTTFHKNCGRGKSDRTTTCPKTVARCKQRHACKILSLQLKPLFPAELHGDNKTVTKLR